MKANELRIGNKFKGIAGIQTVKGIMDYTNNGQYTDPNYSHLITVEENRNQYKPIEIEGIPLTEEWLLKFGFESNYPVVSREYTSESITDLKLIDHYEHGFLFIMIWWKTGTFIKYVHQLQNLYFALTGTELTFK